MPFPLPLDPDFRKEWVRFWLDDVEYLLRDSHYSKANDSWKLANELYLSIAPGNGDMAIEDRMFALRVKLDDFSHPTNENRFY